MFELENLKSIKSKTESRDTERHNISEENYSHAYNYLNQFFNSPVKDIKTLKASADKLIESIKYNKNNPNPYIALSYIFLLLNKKDLSIKYLNIVKKMSPDLEQVTYLTDLITNNKISQNLVPLTPLKNSEQNIPNTASNNKDSEISRPLKINKVQRLKK